MIFDYHHLPICAIMALLFGAFFITAFGTASITRKIAAIVSSLLSLVCLVLLIEPVMINGEVISYWMGSRSIAGGYAIGIALEVDALSLFFGLLISTAVFVSCVYSFKYMSHDDNVPQYYTLFLDRKSVV